MVEVWHSDTRSLGWFVCDLISDGRCGLIVLHKGANRWTNEYSILRESVSNDMLILLLHLKTALLLFRLEKVFE